MYGVERTGVRFVLSSPSDPDRVDDYHAWYDIYPTVVTRLGFLLNCFRFENPAAAGNEEDPRSVAIYDIVTSDPATAWPAIESSERYPKYLFDDPRASLVAPALRGSWAHVGSLAKEGAHGVVTGIHVILSDGADGTAREQWASAVLDTGLFYAASRFELIEGFPDPARWLEIFETDQEDPLTAYPDAVDALAGSQRAAEIRQRRAGSFKFYSAYISGQ
jgi:hypothetical protein